MIRSLVRESRITHAADGMELEVARNLAALLEQEQGPPGISAPPADLERGKARRLEVAIEKKVLEKNERPKALSHKASELEKVKAARLLQSAKAKESPHLVKALQQAFSRARADKQQSRGRGGMER